VDFGLGQKRIAERAEPMCNPISFQNIQKASFPEMVIDQKGGGCA